MIGTSFNRLRDWSRHRRGRLFGICFVSGLILALGQAPVSIPIGFITALPLLGFFAFCADNGREAAKIGFFAGLGYFGLSLVWIIEPFFVEPEKHAVLAPFALIGMAAGLSLFWATGFGLARQLFVGRWRMVLGLAVTLTLAEYARSMIFTGFPWGLLGYSWINTPIAQLAAYVGPHGVGFLTLLAGLSLVAFPARKYVSLMVCIGCFAVLTAGGLARFHLSEDVENTNTIVRLIQPNAAQRLKWQPDWVPVFLTRGLEMTAQKGAKKVDLVIWPETSFPYLMDDTVGDFSMMSRAAGAETQIVFGVQRVEGDAFYNSLVHLDARGGITALYDKQHLVPFGEYIPFAHLLPALGLRGLASKLGGFTTGKRNGLIEPYGLPSYRALICYEAIFAEELGIKENRPDYLMHITNDAWFGDYIGPYQHLVQVQFRAIEQGLPVARAANTGVTAMIDPKGQLVDFIPLNTVGFIDVAIPKAIAQTFYARWGDLPVWIVLLLLGFLGKYVFIYLGKQPEVDN